MTKKKPTTSPNGKRIGRPPLAEATTNLSLRVPVELANALDRYTAGLERQLPGIKITRNDAMRQLLMLGLSQAGVISVEDDQ